MIDLAESTARHCVRFTVNRFAPALQHRGIVFLTLRPERHRDRIIVDPVEPPLRVALCRDKRAELTNHSKPRIRHSVERPNYCLTSNVKNASPVVMDEEQPADSSSVDYWKAERLRLRDESNAIMQFLDEKIEAGVLTRIELNKIIRSSNEVFSQAGLPCTEDTAISAAVDRQALHRMRQKIIELHPEWKLEVDRIPTHRGRTR